MGQSSSAMSLASDVLGVKTSGAVFVAMLRSRTVEDGVINDLNLSNGYHVKKAVDARKILEANTEVAEDRKSGVITLNVEDRDPDRAAEIAHRYVEYLNRTITQSTTSAARRERVFLEERLRSVKQDLHDSEKKFSDFASSNKTLDVKDQGKAMIEAAATLQGQLMAEQSQLKGLQQIYAPDNYRVRSANARIAELKHQMGTLSGTADESSNNTSDSVYPSISDLPRLGVTWSDLYRDTKIEEAVFEALTKQYELAKVEEAKEIPQVGVLDDAEVPERKSGPPRIVITFCTGLVAVFVAGIYIIAADNWARVDPTSPLSVVTGRIAVDVRKSQASARVRRLLNRLTLH
jgi:capsule polysaccharide export protein KpsE/RkpR